MIHAQQFIRNASGHCRRDAKRFVLAAEIVMEAGLTDELLSMESLCAIMDAENPPKKRGPYKKAA
jgi:hypothetical protein